MIYNCIILRKTKENELLGAMINNNLYFSSHIKWMHKISDQKLGALSRISRLLNANQKTLKCSSFIKGQFN